MILYNHLKLGKQTKTFRRAIKNFLPSVVSVPKFLPEIARRFANPQFTNKLVPNEAAVVGFFSNPTGIMADIIGGLAPAERAALALVFSNGGELPIPLRIENPQTTNIITSMQSNLGDVKAALSALDDSLIRISKTQDEHYWKFRHPTIRDAFATDVAGNPELIDIYLSGVTKERLIEEISCGDMGIEGIKLVVPHSMFNSVLNIIDPSGNRALISRPILTFLASRCSTDFLGLYFNSDEAKTYLLDLISSARRYDNSLTILSRLNINGLLGDDLRRKVLDKLSVLASINHSDCFIDADFVGVLLSKEENEARLSVQKVEFYSNMNEIIQDIEDSWATDDDVDEAFYDVTRLLERFRDENNELYCDDFYDKDEWHKSEQFIREIEIKKDKLKQRQTETVDYHELEAEDAQSTNLPLGRSIFDDVDE